MLALRYYWVFVASLVRSGMDDSALLIDIRRRWKCRDVRVRAAGAEWVI